MRAKRLATFAISSVLVLTACQKQPRVAAPPRPAPAPPAPAPRAPAPAAPAPAAPLPAAAAVDQADRAFTAGSYDEAIRAYESALQLSPTRAEREQALFRLGLTYVLRSTPDWQRATSLLKQLVQEYPGSPLKPPANLILSLHSAVDQLTADAKTRDERIRQLSTELEKLKKIDTERRTRP